MGSEKLHGTRVLGLPAVQLQSFSVLWAADRALYLNIFVIATTFDHLKIHCTRAANLKFIPWVLRRVKLCSQPNNGSNVHLGLVFRFASLMVVFPAVKGTLKRHSQPQRDSVKAFPATKGAQIGQWLLVILFQVATYGAHSFSLLWSQLALTRAR